MEDAVSLKRSVISAVGWATTTRLVAQLATWAMTLVTVRLLSPQDYGLMAITVAVGSFLQSMSSVGFANFIVQSPRISDEEMLTVFGLILLINGVCMALLCVLAYPTAWFYAEPRLIPLLQLASLGFVANAAQAIPRATLEKKLDLRTISRIDLVCNISGGAFVLFLAWSGAGVWSLLAGTLFTGFARSIGICFAAPYFRRPRLRHDNLAEILRFGGLRSAENVLWTIYSTSDVFIIGKLLGPQILGVYSVSRYLAAMPVEKLTLVIGPVMFPAFAQVQHDRSEALQYLKKGMRIIAFLCFPAFFGLAATAPQVVEVVLGPTWSQATTPLAILAVGMALRPIGVLISPFLVGIGEYVASFKNTLFATVLFPVAFIVSSHWGLIGICAAWLVAYPLQLVVLLRRVALATRTSMIGLVLPLVPPIAGALVMYGAVRITTSLLPDGLGDKFSLATLVATGVVVYLGYAAAMLRPVFGELSGLVR
jgi:O-antigen/teichoic acid export membrane protein